MKYTLNELRYCPRMRYLTQEMCNMGNGKETRGNPSAKSRQSYLLHSHEELKIVCKSDPISAVIKILIAAWLSSVWGEAAFLL